MARTGRPPTPVEQHKKTGTYRKDRHARGALVAVPSVAPGPLDLPAAQVFEMVLAEGVAWLGQTDSPRLVLLREQLEERESLREAVLAGAGDRKQLRELEKQIAEGLSACGFDPAARTRMGLAEVKARSKLEEIRDRQATRDTKGRQSG